MKRFLGFVSAAALLVSAQSAQAVPTMTLSLSQANGTALQCTALGGSFGGGECSFTSTSGLISVLGGYGDYELNQELAVGFPVQAQPALWLNSINATRTASTITVKLVADEYSFPSGSFPLLSTASGTLDEDMSVSLNSYYDAANTGVAGAGTLLLDADWTGFASGAVPSNSTNVINDGDGLYSVSWILTVTRSTPGQLVATAGINGTLTQESPTGVPAPGGIALLGLGLLGIGAARRYRS
jgi:hypothetical protein